MKIKLDEALWLAKKVEMENGRPGSSGYQTCPSNCRTCRSSGETRNRIDQTCAGQNKAGIFAKLPEACFGCPRA
jgi:hypothetical protein